MGRSAEDRATDLMPEAGPIESWEPEHWSPRHSLVARMSGAGLRNEEIALATGFSKARVSQIVCDQRAKQIIVDAQNRLADNLIDLNVRLKAHSEEALREVVDQMRNDPKSQIRQKAAFGILDRAGYTAVQRHKIEVAPSISPELAAAVLETRAEMEQIAQTITYTLPPTSPHLLAAVDAEVLEESGVE